METTPAEARRADSAKIAQRAAHSVRPALAGNCFRLARQSRCCLHKSTPQDVIRRLKFVQCLDKIKLALIVDLDIDIAGADVPSSGRVRVLSNRVRQPGSTDLDDDRNFKR